jgi:divalent metal cation (Fe/Co/Zn/Cd) transporter
MRILTMALGRLHPSARAGIGTGGATGAGRAAAQRDGVPDAGRAAIVRRGTMLSYVSLAYNLIEAAAAIAVGAIAGSIALLGFGMDSLIELASSVAALWRLRADVDLTQRERVERVTLRVIGLCFVGLAIYIAADAVHALWTHDRPHKTVPGIVVAALSIAVMPVLARAKRTVAARLGSRALEADATQTTLCAYLSAIVLGGLALNALFGWWWADPAAALMLTPIIAREGVAGLRGEPSCADDCRPTR